jgi:ATP-binding cassette subfamily B protein
VGRHVLSPGSTGARGGRRRATARRLAHAARLVTELVWAAWPLSVPMLAVLAVVGGLVPVIAATLQRTVLNDLVPLRAGAGQVHRGTVSAAAGSSGRTILELAMIFGGIGLVSALLPYARRYIQNELGRRLSLAVQDRVYRAINSFPGISRFESPEFADKMQLVRQINDNTVSSFVTSMLAIGQSAITLIGFLGSLELLSPLLGAAAMVMALPALAAQLNNSRKRAHLNLRDSSTRRRQIFYSQLLGERTAAKEIRLFGIGNFFHARMMQELRGINGRQRSLDRKILYTESSLSLIAAFIIASGLVWVVGQLVAGRLSIGDLSLYLLAMTGVQASISGIVSTIAGMYQALQLFTNYADVVSEKADLRLAEPPEAMPPLRHGVELRDVWFRYDADHPFVLKGLNIFIPAGHAAALVGLNGAGKSTIVKLLCRLYDPERGAIYWDGIDIRKVNPADLREHIGTILQDYMTYDLTAAENIGIGDVAHIDDIDRIRGAAISAGADRKVSSLPRGYDTLLSRIFFDNKDKDNPETGVVLSGGEWQRIALGRGLMRSQRDLLILDEPTSGLDVEAEYEIHERLRTVRAGKASLLISHRLASVRTADIIFVLSGGKIVEQGSHEELMQAEGEYSRLFTLQASGYQTPEHLSAVPRSGPGIVTRR